MRKVGKVKVGNFPTFVLQSGEKWGTKKFLS